MSTSRSIEEEPGSEGYHRNSGKGTGDPDRDRLLQEVLVSGRELGLVLVSLNTVAARASGIHPTDAWIISYMQTLAADASPTAGDLARITGLTTGAITGVIDRLERDGHVRRERDPKDRRKVIIVPTAHSADIARAFQPMVEGFMELCVKYTSAELETIISYFRGSIEVAEATIARLRQM